MKRDVTLKAHRLRRAIFVGLLALAPIVAGPSCGSSERFGQARTNAAPAVAALFGAMGDVVGQWIAGIMLPEASDEQTPAS